MRWQVAWPDSVAGWFFWASLVGLISVIGVIFIGAAAALTHEGSFGETFLLVVVIDLAGVVGAFLVGVVLALLRSVTGEREGERESKARTTGLEATSAAAP
ncbi:MAG: hypothetical protein GTO63_30410, partial [Anaerolineae bacterium]|nr:hypothetical protein [Anaerolineae bacterium]NIN98796.1 hypothetical protein [Anaerolineae bacterium]